MLIGIRHLACSRRGATQPVPAHMGSAPGIHLAPSPMPQPRGRYQKRRFAPSRPRLTPSGSPYGRSKWLRHFVEPSFCLSWVRTRAYVWSVSKSMSTFFDKWCRKEASYNNVSPRQCWRRQRLARGERPRHAATSRCCSSRTGHPDPSLSRR
jgi:hypothetical protein